MSRIRLAVLLALAGGVVLFLLWPRERGGSEPPAGSGTPGGSASASPGARPASSALVVGTGGEGAAPGASPTGSANGSPAVDAPSTLEEGQLQTLVTRGGQPVAGAQVRLFWRGAADPNTQKVDWRTAGAGATREDGTLTLPARPGAYLVTARAPGSAPARREVIRPHGEALTRVTLALEPGATLSGLTVVKGGQEPVPLAELTLTASPDDTAAWRSADAPVEERTFGASDPRGRFRFEGLAPGRYRLDATAPGYGRVVERRVQVPRPGELRVEFARASVLEGFVTAADGSPAAGAEVFAIGGEDAVVVTTGPGGGFSAEVESGSYGLSARRGKEAGALPDPVAVAPGATVKGLRIKLGRGSAITGTAVSRSTHAPIPGASIAVSPFGQSGDSGRAVTDARGAFTVDGLAPGSYDLDATANGYSEVVRHGLTVADGQQFPVTLELDGTGTVEGTVRDLAGKPIAGAYVRGGQRWGGSLGTATAEARSGPEGRYQLTGLAVGQAQLSARRDGDSLGKNQRVEVREGVVVQVDFTLSDSGLVSGHVTSPGGGPIGQVAVVRAVPQGSSWLGPGDIATVTPDGSGAYQLMLPPGAYNLRAGLGGRMAFNNRSGALVQVEAGVSQQVDLVLSDERQGVSGVVLEPGGAPSGHAMLAVLSGGMGFIAFTVEEDGHFDVTPQLPAGSADKPLTFRARNGGRMGEAANVAPDATEVTVQLQPGATLRGKVVGTGGNPATGFTVGLQVLASDNFMPPDFREPLEFVGDSFELRDVPAQRVKVTVKTHSGRSGTGEATLASGQTGDLTVTLEPGGAVSGRVVEASTHAPVADAQVNVDEFIFHSLAESGADGRFTVKDVAAGSHVLRIFAPNHAPLIKPIQVVAGQPVDAGELALELPPVSPGTIGAHFIENGTSVTVASITPAGPAARAGLREGDQVASVDGQAVHSSLEAERRSTGLPGTPVAVTFRRGGADQTVQVTRAP